MDALGTTARIVQASNSTMNVKVANKDHPEVTPASFAVVQAVLDGPRMLDDGTPLHRVFLNEVAGHLWTAVVKATKTGKALILSSLYGGKEADEGRHLRRAEKKRREGDRKG